MDKGFLKKIKLAGAAQRDKSLVSTLNFKRNIWNYFEDLTNELLPDNGYSIIL